MKTSTTFVDVMMGTATTAGEGRGIRFYSSPSDSEFRSYGAFDRQARADAATLTARGYAAGEVVILAFDPGLAFIRALYAAFYAGLVASPVPVAAMRQPGAALRRLEAIIADSGSRLVLTDGTALAAMGLEPGDAPVGADVTQVTTLAGEADAAAWTPPPITADSLALLQYTSGSTGTPKGVMVSHGNLVANEAAITSAVGITAESRTMGWLPHYHDMGLVGQLLQPIFVGADSVLTSPSQFLRRPLLWLRLITEYRSTHTVGPDFAYGLCTRLVTDEQLASLDLSSLEGVITGAEPVRSSTLAAFSDRFAAAGFDGRAFIPAYGMAETTLLVTASVRPDAVEPIRVDAEGVEAGELREPTGAGRAVELVSCGPAASGHEIAIMDTASGLRAGEGAIGEILVRGPSVAQGYWRRPDETEQDFRTTLVGGPDDRRYLRTGDLGALIDGELVITGRIKDLIIIRGRNLYPQDLETTAEGFLPSGCLSAAFEGLGTQPAVGLVAEVDAARVSADELERLAEEVRKRVVDEYTLPELGVVFIRKGTLPRTTSGKVQRALTRSLLADERLATVVRLGFDRTPA
ncbi:Acyl-CoA synthetase (AMP-forming)/AMP-acid ligase II [Agromyces sp. CF514]|uniref:fatty acyl-AMP ligase n=1 Tax=Agromyces sp. CF514 TaxID=1881031 RepID=UPI0008F22773|nr:fatty acyl-AMP ligase [Agromyces sp. CF514]SFR72389.1 Acyl-CoA synthetase (AMP-forming)/AMP-acid ligase II [Agromyces sp. CF514]